MQSRPLAWTPVSIMALASIVTLGIDLQRPLPLREPLATAIPEELDGYTGTDSRLSEAHEQAAGMTDYVMRTYRDTTNASEETFSIYVAYYDHQSLGRTIHSPKNCLPGTGWQALASRKAEVPTPRGPVTVNRYLVQRDEDRVLVLYWYQGRGRVESSEYRVKWDLLRDSALKRRSDEALVRIVVPIGSEEAAAWERARRVAERILPAVEYALPRA